MQDPWQDLLLKYLHHQTRRTTGKRLRLSFSLFFFFTSLGCPLPYILPCRHTWDREIRFPGENVTGFRRRGFSFQSFAFVVDVVKANLKATPFFFCQSSVPPSSSFCNSHRSFYPLWSFFLMVIVEVEMVDISSTERKFIYGLGYINPCFLML